MVKDKMRVLVTGSQGQLGNAIVEELTDTSIEFLGASRSLMDVTNHVNILKVLDDFKPTHVIHCAAYTNVDQAEVDKDLCYLVNVEATKTISKWCADNGSRLIFYSTDYVFDGSGELPHLETDLPHPINYYGMSKYEAEKWITATLQNHVIYRVSWLYGKKGKNFVKTMKDLLSTKDSINVVDDQIGAPTNVKDLAQYVINHLVDESPGIYHLRNEGFVSWFQFAKMIQDRLRTSCQIQPVKSKDFNKPNTANRPLNSRLGSIHQHTTLRTIEEALDDFMNQFE